MKTLSETLSARNSIYANLKVDSIACIPLGGSTLIQWVDKDYLNSLNLPQIFVFDGDKIEYIDKANQINNENNSLKIAFTSLPYNTFENILSIEKIKEDISARYPEISNLESLHIDNNIDTATSIAKFVYERDSTKFFNDLDDDKRKKKINSIKKWLNNDVPAKMSAEEIIQNDSAQVLLKILGTVTNYLNNNQSVYEV